MKKKILRTICLILPMLLIVTTASGSQDSPGTPLPGGLAPLAAEEALSQGEGPLGAMHGYGPIFPEYPGGQDEATVDEPTDQTTDGQPGTGGNKGNREGALAGEQGPYLDLIPAGGLDALAPLHGGGEQWARVSQCGPIQQIAAGYGHSLVLTSDGSVWAFGNNCYGQLGDGTTKNSRIPVQVAGLPQIVAIEAGSFHNLAIDGDGYVWAWGRNANGQLGDGTTTDRAAPVQAAGICDAFQVSAGHDHSLLLDSSQNIWAWGGNGEGQLGDGTTTDRPTPVQIDASGYSGDLSMGYDSSLTPDSRGDALDRGGNGGSKLGGGLPIGSGTASMIRPPNSIIAISAGHKRSLACRRDGSVYAWGDNWDRQSPWVEKMAGFDQVFAERVIAGTGSNVAFSMNEGFWGWGQNWDDWTGAGTSTPIEIPELVDVRGVSLGCSRGLALTTDGSVWEWDEGPGTASFVLVQRAELPVAVAVAAGYDHYLALDSDGRAWAWGNNDCGQFGNGTTEGNSAPVPAAVRLGEEPASAIELQLTSGKTYLIAVKAENVPGFQDTTYTLEYDEEELRLIDFAAQTAKLDTGEGPVGGTPLTIVSASQRELSFTADIAVPSGRKWSGTLTVLRFAALASGAATVKIFQSTT